MENTIQEVPKNTPSTGICRFRKFVMAILTISNIAISVLSVYLLASLALESFGLNLGQFFSFSNFQLDIMSALGIWVIAVLIVLALFVIVILISVIKINKNYYYVLKTANEQNLSIYLAPWQTFASACGFIGLSAILTFLSFIFLNANPQGLPTILTLICVAIMVLSLVLLSILSLYNRAKYSKLSEQEQQEVKEQSKQFKKEMQKKQDKKQAGKLY